MKDMLDERKNRSNFVRDNSGEIVLKILTTGESCLYGIHKSLRNKFGISLYNSTLQELLRGLESEGYISNEGFKSTGKRQRKVYAITDSGIRAEQKLSEYSDINMSTKKSIKTGVEMGILDDMRVRQRR